MTAPVLRLANAAFGYDGKVAARADFAIESGEVVALLGANGSGKSTIVKGVLDLIDQQGGTVEWFGQSLGSFRDRARLGYVPQRELAASPIPATLAEVVRSGRVARRGLIGRYSSDDRRAVDEAIAAVGLSDRRHLPVRQLSGGQQRRTLVARALAGEPDVLVLDEPFAGVDHASQVALAATFRDLVARDVTLVVVLHELGPLEGTITRTICLESGTVAYDGPPAEHPDHAHDHDDADPHGGHPPSAEHDTGPRLGLIPR